LDKTSPQNLLWGRIFFCLARVIIVKVTLELFKRWKLMMEEGESEIFLET